MSKMIEVKTEIRRNRMARYQYRHRKRKQSWQKRFLIFLSLLVIGGISKTLYDVLFNKTVNNSITHSAVLHLSNTEKEANKLQKKLPTTADDYSHFNQTVQPANNTAKTMELQLKQEDFSGVALVICDNHIILQKGYGYANYAEKKKNNPYSVFQIASIQKSLTTSLIMKAVHNGLLSLDDPLSRFYPKVPNSDHITLHQMLTMTSGLRNTGLPKKLLNDDQLIAFAVSNIKCSKHGKWHYEAINYTLLAGILEKVTQKSYNQLVNEELIQALNLKNTYLYKDFLMTPHQTKSYLYKKPVNYSYPSAMDPIGFNRELGTGNIGMTTGDLYWYFYQLIHGNLIDQNAKQELFNPLEKNKYTGGIYNYKNYFHSRGVENNYESEIYMSKDGKNAVILFSNRYRSGNTYKDLSKNFFQMLYPSPID